MRKPVRNIVLAPSSAAGPGPTHAMDTTMPIRTPETLTLLAPTPTSVSMLTVMKPVSTSSGPRLQ